LQNSSRSYVTTCCWGSTRTPQDVGPGHAAIALEELATYAQSKPILQALDVDECPAAPTAKATPSEKSLQVSGLLQLAKVDNLADPVKS
jgi:hypothetical protein